MGPRSGPFAQSASRCPQERRINISLPGRRGVPKGGLPWTGVSCRGAVGLR